MALATRPSNVRVYQFHHPGGGREKDYSVYGFTSQENFDKNILAVLAQLKSGFLPMNQAAENQILMKKIAILDCNPARGDC